MNSRWMQWIASSSLRLLLFVVVAWLLPAAGSPARAAEPNWIWTSQRGLFGTAPSTCYLRKAFEQSGARAAEIEIACDASYILYINGVKLGSGNNWRALDRYNITPYLENGSNVVAVVADRNEKGPSGLVARITLEGENGRVRQIVSDETWMTSLSRSTGWQLPDFRDRRWREAEVLGPLTKTAPWGKVLAAALKKEKNSQDSRFRVAREFRVEWIVQPESTGSLLAMAFNEFGHIVAANEEGKLLLIRDRDVNGIPETVTTCCDQIQACQGILPINGELIVTGQGPEGLGVYRLTDKDRNGQIDRVKAIVKFAGENNEHGPHGVRLGPDGLIYVIVGNHARLADEPAATSPYRHIYEGDLVRPRYNDPRGHAAEVAAPGGTVIRTDLEGSFVERVAGGIRNAYDFAFDPQGELFTADSDMEWDQGMPWYRPTRIYHVVPAGEYGWRGGWAKWPDYFLDVLPPVVNTGRGSPTGVAIYEHHMFPQRFHGTMFVGDWSEGRILAVNLRPKGGSFTATTKVFLEGNPLNVTDLAVGPDGWLYFCTGGRGSEGGIYRVVWTGQVPREVRELGSGVARAIRQPQLDSAWARQEIARLKRQLGEQTWKKELNEAALARTNDAKTRLRALSLMQLFGPFPTPNGLIQLSQDRDSAVRAKAAYLMGIHASEATLERLVELLKDPSPAVQRIACESLLRSGGKVPAEALIAQLASPDRHVARAAQQTLAAMPAELWQEKVLAADNLRVFLVGSAGLVVAHGDKETCLKLLDRCQRAMKGFVSDGDFIDLLRLEQLALEHGNIDGDEVPELRAAVSHEYPAGEARINRELVRLMAHLGAAPAVADRLLAQLKSDLPNVEKMQLAMYAPRMAGDWSWEEKLALIEFYEQARAEPGGNSVTEYLDRGHRDLIATLSDEQRAELLAGDKDWPTTKLWALAGLPAQPDAATIERLITLDESLAKQTSQEAKRLRTGIAAVFGRSGQAEAMAHLRRRFDEEPQQRSVLAMALAQQPDDKANWSLLLRALPVLENNAATVVLGQLAKCERGPEQPEPIRQVILLGLRSNDAGVRQAAIALLNQWTGHLVGQPEDSDEAALAAWQTWFSAAYPSELTATLPAGSPDEKYDFEELLAELTGPAAAQGDAHRGRLVFEKAQCAKCHRFGEQGAGIGPDLTTVSRRFQVREILESIVYPSQVISDQYASKSVLTADGITLSGLVTQEPDGGVTILTSDGSQRQLAADEIEQIAPSSTSAMPAGLLDELTPEEIADLFAYLRQTPVANVTRAEGNSGR